jgi:glycosyltransferase involved in cell wall biosynthesis
MKKTNKQPLVSVIMPAFNAGKFIADAIASITSQTYSNWELIVVDDGSTDNTKQIIRSFSKSNKKIKPIFLRKNHGESAAANIGFSKTKGKYIARIDADDIAHPKRLEKQIEFLEKHTDYILVGSQAIIIDENNQVIGKKIFPKDHQEIYKQYGTIHPILHPSIMVRRSLLPNKNKLWANLAEPNDDYYTLINLIQYGKFHNLPEKLMSYRMHANNKSLNGVKEKFINTLKIRYSAVTKSSYPLTVKMVASSLIQSIIVLSLPSWLVVGSFLWIKGMKPFNKAFPQLNLVKQRLTHIEKNQFYWDYALPALLAVISNLPLIKKTH